VIAANSQAAIRYATEHGVRPERLYFLPNVVDTKQMKPVARRGEHPVRLITVGSLIQCKRFDRFLSILARLRSEVDRPVSGVIIGAGPLREQLEKQAGALGLLPSTLQFRGSVSDVASVYQEADICVLTSDYEGTPNVLLEAMASGLPVVATKVGGVPEIVRQGKNGFVVEPGDETSLCAALVRLINDSRLRMQMGRDARAYVEANHSLDRLPIMLHGLYRLALL
jgi:glycosyltransferase involved in cell wall biosynthesis